MKANEMAEQIVGDVWTTVQELILGLQRRDPTVRRWLVPGSDAALLFDLYGELALLILLKDYLDKDRFALIRLGHAPEQRTKVQLAELAWLDEEGTDPTEDDLVTVQLRMYHRKWRVEDVWPSPLNAPLTVEQAREIAERQGEDAPPAILFTAGMLELPLEGYREMDDVEAFFVLGMDAHGYSPREVVRAVRLWQHFCQKARPSYRKPATFAAAVEYAFNLLGFYKDTQETIADYYGVSTSSLSANFAQIRDQLRLTAFDPRYSVFQAPLDRLDDYFEALGLPPPPQLKLGRGFTGTWKSR